MLYVPSKKKSYVLFVTIVLNVVVDGVTYPLPTYTVGLVTASSTKYTDAPQSSTFSQMFSAKRASSSTEIIALSSTA